MKYHCDFSYRHIMYASKFLQGVVGLNYVSALNVCDK